MAIEIDLATRIAEVRERVHGAARRAGRSIDDVTIVAAAKQASRDEVARAIVEGIEHFGENRVQAAVAKYADPLPEDVSLHLIGQLQTNKSRQAVGLFDLIESVDRPSLIDALEAEGRRREIRIPILLQVNVAGEAQKSGCTCEEAADLVTRIVACEQLELRGLMTIAPLVAEAEATRPVFRTLRKLRDDLARSFPQADLAILSMGMTNDFAVAIAEGATHVRIGRAIFGA